MLDLLARENILLREKAGALALYAQRGVSQLARSRFQPHAHGVAIAGIRLRNDLDPVVLSMILSLILFQNVQRGIGRAVVDADYLQIRFRLLNDALKAFPQTLLHVEHRHQHGY